MAKIRVKMHADLPFHLEQKMVAQNKFTIYARKHREFVIFEKNIAPVFKQATEAHVLSDESQTTLIKACNKILEWYDKPDMAAIDYSKPIRIRIENLARSKTPLEREFLLDWMDRNVPASYETHPGD